MTQINLPPISRKFGVKPEPGTVCAIAKGVVAGCLSDHFLGRREAEYESAIRPHVLAAAHARQFGATLEYPLEKKVPGRGARKKIDLLLLYGYQAIAIELKTIRRNGVGFALENDISKLCDFVNLARSADRFQRRVSAWQLIAWHSGTFNKVNASTDTSLNDGIRYIQAAIDSSRVKTPPIGANLLNANVPRTMSSGDVIFVDGHVGNYRAWCVGICVKSP